MLLHLLQSLTVSLIQTLFLWLWLCLQGSDVGDLKKRVLIMRLKLVLKWSEFNIHKLDISLCFSLDTGHELTDLMWAHGPETSSQTWNELMDLTWAHGPDASSVSSRSGVRTRTSTEKRLPRHVCTYDSVATFLAFARREEDVKEILKKLLNTHTHTKWLLPCQRKHLLEDMWRRLVEKGFLKFRKICFWLRV